MLLINTGVENVHTLCAGKPESDDRGNNISVKRLGTSLDRCIERHIKNRIIIIKEHFSSGDLQNVKEQKIYIVYIQCSIPNCTCKSIFVGYLSKSSSEENVPLIQSSILQLRNHFKSSNC